MTPHLLRDLTAILEEPLETAERALTERLLSVASAPPITELHELARRARTNQATSEELALALGALLAIHAGSTGAVEL